MALWQRKTRGRTSPGRLRALDAWVVRHERAVLEPRPSQPGWSQLPFVDVGFGEHPATTLESAEAFRRIDPALPVIGIEQEPHRVEAAREFEDDGTRFVAGGFDSLATLGGPIRLLRAVNVLRTYPEEAAARAHDAIAEALAVGGLAIEGTTDAAGAISVVHLLRGTDGGLLREALLFHTDFTQGFAPIQFRDWLPRDLRRRVKRGEPIHAFFERWTAAWNETRGPYREDPRSAFRAAALQLAKEDPGVRAEESVLSAGYLLWRPEGGVPRGAS